MCVLILLYVCPHTTLCLPATATPATPAWNLSHTHTLVYVCTHTTICVSSYCSMRAVYCYRCVLIPKYMCPHSTRYVCTYCYKCVLIRLYVSACCYTCALLLLYMCPHTLNVCPHTRGASERRALAYCVYMSSHICSRSRTLVASLSLSYTRNFSLDLSYI